MPRLPVAGLDVSLRLPTGADDILLLEADGRDFAVAIALLERVVTRADGQPIDCTALSVTDIDVLLLRLRQRVLGDLVRADVFCGPDGCGAHVDIAFSIEAYLGHHRPRAPARLAATEPGWFRLQGTDVEFRLPRATDLVAIAAEARPAESLLRRCARPAQMRAAVRRRVETAMEAMAPSLRSPLEGKCPECGAIVTVDFDPLRYTLRELRDQAAFVYEEVCTIARHTHWSEADILALPAARRARYVELAALPRMAT